MSLSSSGRVVPGKGCGGRDWLRPAGIMQHGGIQHEYCFCAEGVKVTKAGEVGQDAS